MNKKFIFVIFSLLVAVIGICVLPNEDIPLHWGLDGNIDGYGSKYFLLFFPVIATIMWGTRLLEAKISTEDSRSKEYVEIIAQVFFILLEILLLCSGLMASYEDKMKYVIAGVISLLEIVCAVLMIGINRNRTFGIRTRWSLYNDVTWKKTNKIGSIILFITSIITIIVPFISSLPLLHITIVAFCVGVLLVLVSYLVYKKEKDKECLK